MPLPKDQNLYEKIKKEIYLKYPKHSAYRSGLLVKKYKEEYQKKHKNNVAYVGDASRASGGLNRWFEEVWLNQRGEVGYKKKGDVYRPTVRVSSKTPTTFQELTTSQIKKAMKEKKQKGRVKKFKI